MSLEGGEATPLGKLRSRTEKQRSKPSDDIFVMKLARRGGGLSLVLLECFLCFSFLLQLLLHVHFAVAQASGGNARPACDASSSCPSVPTASVPTAPATTTGSSSTTTSWCNHGIRKIDVAIDPGRPENMGWETTVPVYFSTGDDLAAVARSFLRTYIIDKSAQPMLVKEMVGEVQQRKEPSRARCSEPGRFFVEIGTSDFGTLHQQLYLEPEWEGVAVEPLHELLSALPSRPGLYKENAAFGCAKTGGLGAKTVRRALVLLAECVRPKS